MKNKSIVIGIGAATLVGVGAFFIFRKQTNAEKNDAVSSANSGATSPTTIVGTGDISEIPSKITITGERNPLAGLDLTYIADIIGGNKYSINWEAKGGSIISSTGKQVVVRWDTSGRTKLICTLKSEDGTTIKSEFSITESWQFNIDLSGIPLGNGSL